MGAGKCELEKTITQDSSQRCCLGGASQAISGLKGSAIIIHGSPGCAWMARWMRSDQALTNYCPAIATGLLEHEIIFGGKEKLTKLVEWALTTWKPGQLFILQGCSGSLINDPVEIVVADFEKSHKIPIIYLDTGGFRGLEATGNDMVFSAMLDRFSKTSSGEKKGTVNIIAPYLSGSNNWPFDLEEIKRLLNLLGLKINCILTYNTSVEEVERFSEAEADIFLTFEELSQLKDYEEEHGIKRLGLDLPLPIGIANTEDWFYGIAKEFGKEEKAREVFKEERTILEPLKYHYNATWVQTWMANKYASVIGPSTWAASFANFLYFDMAAFPAVIALYGETEESMGRARKILGGLTKYYDPLILENPLYIQAIDAIRECHVDFAIGQTQEKSLLEGHGIPHLSLAGVHTIFGAFNFIPYPSTGIRGVLYLLSMMGRLIEHTFHEPLRWQDLRFRRRQE